MGTQSRRKRTVSQRYQLLQSLAPNVWLAKDRRQHDQLVAVKRTSRLGLAGLTPWAAQATIQAIEREQQLLATFSHEQIPAYVDHFSDETYWYLVQEWIQGISLLAYQCCRPPLVEGGSGDFPSLKPVLSIGIQLCRVLAYLHAQHPPVIHRDVKPRNALITPEGRLVLIDFGISWSGDSQEKEGRLLSGTRGFCPPEHYARQTPTPLEDVYSLGATMACLLLGEDPRDVSRALADLLFPCRGFPEELHLLLRAMIERERHKRPSSIQVVAKTLISLFEQVAETPCSDNALRSALLSPQPGSGRWPALGETRRYLFRAATKNAPEPCWVWATCSNAIKQYNSSMIEVEFLHPSQGTVEQRWLSSQQLWRFPAVAL